MASIKCKYGHVHGSVGAVKACQYAHDTPGDVDWSIHAPAATSPATASGTSAPVFTPVRGESAPTVAPRVAPVALMTQAQRDAITRLGGDAFANTTRLEASALITRLSESAEETRRRRAAAFEKMQADRPVHQTTLGIPAELIFNMREGRFAVSLDGTAKLHFVRLSIVKKSQYKSRIGCMRIQTQHSDALKERALINRNGEVYLTSATMPVGTLTAIIMAIMPDQREAAIRYGREKGMCCRCGRELTDERSRHYGIGPECEKHWPEIILEIDEAEGAYVQGALL